MELLSEIERSWRDLGAQHCRAQAPRPKGLRLSTLSTKPTDAQKSSESGVSQARFARMKSTAVVLPPHTSTPTRSPFAGS